MRYGIVSDLHANLQAWNAVYADMTAQGVERIICLGDIVGYGPRPAETLASVYEKVDLFVLGNHDAVVAGLLDSSGFNPDAKRMIEWTKRQLHKRAIKFFNNVPLMTYGASFRCAHGAVVSPEKFYYVNQEKVARACFKHCSEQLIFVGHTHKASIHRIASSGAINQFTPKDFHVREGERYIINVGSTGMPRDRDFRATYCIYDESKISFRKVAFDLDSFRADMHERVGESKQAACVLACFNKSTNGPRREAVDFSPAKSKVSKRVVTEQKMSELRSRARLWKLISIAALALLTCLLFFVLSRNEPQRLVLTGANELYIGLGGKAAGTNVSLLPAVASTRPADGCRYICEHAAKQKIFVSEAGLHLRSAVTDKGITVEFPLIRMGTCRKVQFKLHGMKLLECTGDLPMLVIDYILADNREEKRARTKSIAARADQLSTSYTFPIRKDVKMLRPRLVGSFSGEVVFSDIQMVLKEDG